MEHPRKWSRRVVQAGATLALATTLSGCGYVVDIVAAHAILPELLRRILTGQSTDLASVASSPTVRADVASWVNGQKQLSPQQTAALMQLARATQATLSVDLKDPAAVSRVATQQVAALQCVSYRGVEFATGPSIDVLGTHMTADTPAKQVLMQAFNVAASGLGPLAQVAGSGCAAS